MQLKSRKVDPPAIETQRRGRKSTVEPYVMEARKAAEEDGKAIELTGEPEDVDRFYRAIVQWRLRNKKRPIAEGLRYAKAGNSVTIWVDPTEESGD